MESTKDNPLRAEKKKKMLALREKGLELFPHNFKPSIKATELHEKYDHIETGQVLEEVKVSSRDASDLLLCVGVHARGMRIRETGPGGARWLMVKAKGVVWASCSLGRS